jgi:tetratricopeptide (TPR) repeat protein
LDPVQIKTEARKQMHLGQPQEAVRLLQDMIPYYSQDAEAHALLGAALSQSGNESGSVPYFEQAVRLEPQRATYHFNLGVAYEKAGQLQWALEGYRRALEIDPSLSQATAAYYRVAPKVGMMPQPAPVGMTDLTGAQYAPPVQQGPPSQFGAPQYGTPQYGVPQYGAPPIPRYAQPAVGGPHRWAEAPQIVKSARFLNFFSFAVSLLVILTIVLAAISDSSTDALVGAVVLLIFCVPFAALFLWLAIAHKNATRAAWTVQIVLSIIGALFFPLGTLIHVYLLCYWFKPETKFWFGV